MKKSIILLISTILVLLTSCNKGIEPEIDSNATCEISLNFVGEISTTITPLTKSINSADLLGIQVYKINNGSESKFAYGLFDDASNIKLHMQKGFKYRIVATVLKNGKSLLYKSSSGYYYPFNRGSSNTNITNSFIYSTSSYFDYLGSGMIENTGYDYVKYPEALRYYAEVLNYSPVENGSLPIELKHTGFGIKYKVKGLTDGTLALNVKNSSRSFIDESAISSDGESDTKYFSFYNVSDAWKYADDYMEDITVSVKWARGIGVTSDLGSKTVKVKRNQINSINVTLSSDDGGGSLNFNVEPDSSMGGETLNVNLGN